MRLPVTNMCGGFLAMVYIWMSLKVGLYRKKNKISMGDNGNKTLQEMGHGNFIEYVPIFLILLTLAESQKLGVLVPLSALIFIIGRCSHASVFFFQTHYKFRFYGMICTITGISSLGIANTILGLAQLFTQ